jgi:putative polyhydroxyalkanoate system protein
MTDLSIVRHHALGLRKIRKIAFAWAEQAEQEFGMQCIYQEGRARDELLFTRPGVQGRLLATHNKVEINVELGALFRAFKSRIEDEIVKNLDALLEGKGH